MEEELLEVDNYYNREVVLIGNNYTDLSQLPDSITNCQVLNLHGNSIRSLLGLPLLELLTELNLSSNELVTCEELQLLETLPLLQKLDLSSNHLTNNSNRYSDNKSNSYGYIHSHGHSHSVGNSVLQFPYLPGLLSLSLAHNKLTTLNGLENAVPSLEYLDIRDNHFKCMNDVLAISLLPSLIVLLVGSCHSNSAGHSGKGYSHGNTVFDNINTIVELFNRSPSLELVDNYDKNYWLDLQLQFPTPTFDRISRHFKLRSAANGYAHSNYYDVNNSNPVRDSNYQHVRQIVRNNPEETTEDDSVNERENSHENIRINTSHSSNNTHQSPNNSSKAADKKAPHVYYGKNSAQNTPKKVQASTEVTVNNYSNRLEPEVDDNVDPSVNYPSSSDHNNNNSSRLETVHEQFENESISKDTGNILIVKDTNNQDCDHWNDHNSTHSSTNGDQNSHQMVSMVKANYFKGAVQLYILLQTKFQNNNTITKYKLINYLNIWRCNSFEKQLSTLRKCNKDQELLLLKHMNKSKEEKLIITNEYEKKISSEKIKTENFQRKFLQHENSEMKLRKDLLIVQEKYTLLEQENSVSKNEVSSLTITVNELTQQNSSLHDTLQRITTENDNLQLLLDEKSSNCEKLSSELLYTNSILTAKENNSQMELSNKNNQLLQLQSELQKLLVAVESQKQENIVQQQLVNSLTTEKKQLQDQLLAHDSKEQLHNELRSKFESRLLKLKHAFEETITANNELQQQNNNLLQENKDQKSLLVSNKKTIKELSKFIKQLQTAIELKQDDYNNNCMKLNNKLEVLLTQNQKLLESNLLLETKEKELVKEIELLRDQNSIFSSNKHMETSEKPPRSPRNLKISSNREEKTANDHNNGSDSDRGSDRGDGHRHNINTLDQEHYEGYVQEQEQLEGVQILHSNHQEEDDVGDADEEDQEEDRPLMNTSAYSDNGIAMDSIDIAGLDFDSLYEHRHPNSEHVNHNQSNNNNHSGDYHNNDYSDEIESLKTAIRVKDTMLEDQSLAIQELKQKLTNSYEESDLLHQSIMELETQLEDSRVEITELMSKVNSNNDMEEKINKLVEEFQKTANLRKDIRSSFDSLLDEDRVETINKQECRNPKCTEEKKQLVEELALYQKKLEIMKDEYETKYKRKCDECDRIVKALTMLEDKSREITETFRHEKRAHEEAFEKTNKERKQLQKQIKKLNSELATKIEDLSKAKSAIAQLQNAFVDFQRISSITNNIR